MSELYSKCFTIKPKIFTGMSNHTGWISCIAQYTETLGRHFVLRAAARSPQHTAQHRTGLVTSTQLRPAPLCSSQAGVDTR